MTTEQKQICKELIRLSIEHGFGCRYPLAPIAEKFKIKEPLYDNDTNTGILWKLGPHGNGILDISHTGQSAGVDYDTHQMLENWCR